MFCRGNSKKVSRFVLGRWIYERTVFIVIIILVLVIFEHSDFFKGLRVLGIQMFSWWLFRALLLTQQSIS